VANAHTFAGAIRTGGQPRTDTPVTAPVPVTEAAPQALAAAAPVEPLNGHQKALIAFSDYLEREIKEPGGKPARTAAMMAGPLAKVETAKKRVELFLAEQKRKAGGT